MDCPVYAKKEDNMFSILDNIVFLDIEASELGPKKSEIIGVGAVKVDEGSIELFESTSSLQDISFHLKNFLGNKTIIVHNAYLVRYFLKYNMPEIKNKILDSMELVVILEPYHREYSLKYLKKILINNDFNQKIGALGNAIDTLKIVNAILARLENVESKSLEPLSFKVNSYLNSFGLAKWEWSEYLNNINQNLISKVDVKYTQTKDRNRSDQNIEKEVIKKIQKIGKLYEELLKDKEVWKSKEGFIYEYRSGQYELSKTIREVFNRGFDDAKIACIEAPTGIGKSVGYLLPAILEARLNKKRVLISTNTKELQIQLINKDIPNVLNSLGLNEKISYGYIKGKNNYICLEKLENYKSEYNSSNVTESEILSIIYLERLVESGQYGDIEEINHWILEHFNELKTHLKYVSCDPNLCRPKKCNRNCLYKKRVEELKEEHITVINHSLLAKWPYKEEKPLEYIIVDEAHNLTEKGYEFFSRVVNSKSAKYFLEEIYPYDNIQKSALLYSNAKNKSRRIKPFDRFYSYIKVEKNVKDKISRNINLIVEEMNSILDYGKFNYNNVSEYNLSWELNLQKNEILGKLIKNNVWTEITYENYTENIKLSCDNIIKNLTSILFLIGRYMDDDSLDKESEVYIYGKSKMNDIEEMRDTLQALLEYSEDDDFARIVDIDSNFENFEFRVVPLKLASLFEDNILDKVEGAVFLSATLSVDNSMYYFKNTLGIDRVKNVSKIIEPLYDYKSRVKVLGLNDICSYKNADFTTQTGKIISDIYEISDGNILSLFNSKRRQEETYDVLKKGESDKDISVYMNKTGIKYLKNIENKRSIVLGSKGCFEGVDVPGDGLTCVTLDKIPNISPQDPLYFSIMKKYNKSYYEINYPKMSIKIKQAMGRILRSRYDYGCFVIFDVGTNNLSLKRLERELHGCNIVITGRRHLLKYIKNHLDRCRVEILKLILHDIFKLPGLNEENDMNKIKEHINVHMKNRCIKSEVYQVDQTKKLFKIKYFGKKYLIDKEQFRYK